MASINKKKTKDHLKKKGFIDAPGDHNILELYYNEKLILHTKVSHGSNSKEIDNYLIAQMSNQCKLKKYEFIKLARCPMKKKEYFNILLKKGVIK